MGQLDRHPFDVAQPDALQLIDFLSKTYTSNQQVLYLARAAGVDLGFVNQDLNVPILWQELALAASKQDRLRALVELVRSDPNSSPFRPLLTRLLNEPRGADPADSLLAAVNAGTPEGGLLGVVVGQPPPLAPAYQKRDAARARVDEAWAHRGAGPTCLLISGDSGVGKSQFAAGVFWDSASTALRAWVPAASQETLLSAYAAIASALGCAGTGDVGSQARALIQWLASPAAGSWLLVLDDLALDPHQMWDWWPPSTPRGRVVVTTTHRDAAFDGHGRSWIRLDVYSPAEAVSYLTDRLSPHLGVDIPGSALSEAEDLAKDLGFLPVALAQAAAAIIDAGSSCARYRQRFADQATSLSVLFPEGAAATPTDTVATTWSLSIERADKIPPTGLARPAAAVCAVTHPDGVPDDLWITQAVRAYLNRHRTPATPAPALEGGANPVSIPDAEAALRALHLLSIVTITKGGAAAGVRIHGLAQRAIWDTITDVQRSETIRAAADGLAEIWPDVEKDIALATVLRSNAIRLADLDLNTLWSPPRGHPVLSRLGKSLGEAGLTSQARDFYGHLASVAADRFGPDHAETLTTRGNVALWTGVAGDASKAREEFAKLLDDRVRVFGPDDPSTLTTRNDLAYWTGQAGDPVEAVKAFTELLPDRERLLGPDDPATLTTRNDLALWTGEAGDKAGARDQYARLLDDQLRLLGAGDPATLSTRSHLALWTGEAGDAAEARDQFARLLHDQERVLGLDHPDTFTTRSDLALWTGEAGDAVGARDQFARLRPDQVRVLGPDNPRTLTTRFNLALWTEEAGDPAGARDQFAELLPDRVRALGDDHPDTLRTRCNLAQAQGMAGDLAEAATALASLLPDLVQALGPDDTDTLKAQSSLARWRAETGTGVPDGATLAPGAAPSTRTATRLGDMPLDDHTRTRLREALLQALTMPDGSAVSRIREPLTSEATLRAWLNENLDDDTLPSAVVDLTNDDRTQPMHSIDVDFGDERAYLDGPLPGEVDSFDNVESPSVDRDSPRQTSEVGSRQWRADIENHNPDTPLQVGSDYAFLFSVDPESAGAVATEDFDESLFTDESVEVLTLTVQVSSGDFDIRSEPVADLVVPRMARTPVPARFVVSARHGGACTITAAVHLHGNFVNLLHFTVWAGTAGPATLTKVGRPPDALRHLEPRDMSLILQRASRSGYECIVKAGGVQSPTVFLPITTEELAAEIDHIQHELLSVVKLRDDTGALVFQTGVQIPAPLEEAALRTLAKAGGRLFRKLFFHAQAGPDAQELGGYLRAEASDDQTLLTLQVVDKEAAIPWALLYVGDVSDDARLDWEFFLGLRHLIEQVPLGPLLPGRTLKIRSEPELTVGLNLNLRVGPDLVNSEVQEHQQRWQDLPSRRKGLLLRPRSTRTAVLDALRDPANGDQIVYFYCHASAQGRNDDTGRAAITMEPNSPLTLDELNDNAGVSIRLLRQPLVFINACESADLTPLFYTGFVPYFLSRGARGVIGTQSKTPGLFAIRFAESFFDRLFDAQPIGEAMLATRREFLDRYRNPLGLLYAVHCDIDTRIDPAMLAPSA
jgi:hypothetical protein